MNQANWHLLGLALIVVCWAAAGYIFVGQQPVAALEEFGRQRVYWIAILSEWMLLFYVVWGLSRPRMHAVRAIIDPAPWTAARWIRYAAAAAAAMLIWGLVGFLIGKAQVLRPSPEGIRRLMVFMPRDAADKTLWIALSLTAAFCEEFVYRGFLLQQVQRLSHRTWLAIVVQAVAYGAAHAALPWQIMVHVTLLGVLFGTLSIHQRSLAPAMLLHAVMDLLPGLVPRR